MESYRSERNPSATKAGPGRRHKQGHKKATPKPQRGAPAGFVQHINPERKGRRAAVIKAHGIRQWKRLNSRGRRLADFLGAGA